MRFRSFLPAVTFALVLPSIVGLSCHGDPIETCGLIPEGGCPVSRGGSCEDATCLALYTCVDGAWAVTEDCPPIEDAGADGDAGDEADAWDGSCTVPPIDHTGQTTGCVPDLQSPDCPIEAAESCAETACLTRCTDFFLCTKDGWVALAYCDDQGTLVVGAGGVR